MHLILHGNTLKIIKRADLKYLNEPHYNCWLHIKVSLNTSYTLFVLLSWYLYHHILIFLKRIDSLRENLTLLHLTLTQQPVQPTWYQHIIFSNTSSTTTWQGQIAFLLLQIRWEFWQSHFQSAKTFQHWAVFHQKLKCDRCLHSNCQSAST